MPDITLRMWRFGIAYRKVRVKKEDIGVIIWFFPFNGKLNFYIYPSIPKIFKMGMGSRTLEGVTEDIENIVKSIALQCVRTSNNIKKRNLKRITHMISN